MTGRRVVQVMVCGNADRCDDGAALRAVEHLAAAGNAVRVVHCGQLDLEHLLENGPGAPTLIVDAAAGVAPGRVVTLDFDTLLARPKDAAPQSSHALPIDQVIGIARALSDEPIDGLFVGIGGADFGFGPTLSPAVSAALPEFMAAIDAAVARLGATINRPRLEPAGA